MSGPSRLLIRILPAYEVAEFLFGMDVARVLLHGALHVVGQGTEQPPGLLVVGQHVVQIGICLLYTSDAADE